MATSYHHAVSSARKFGGIPEDYIAIHTWFDESKMHWADFRHRALRHHTEGIFLAEKIFGVTLTNSEGKIMGGFPLLKTGMRISDRSVGWEIRRKI